MKKTVLCLILVLVVSLPAVCFADTWYCPECGRLNDRNFCPVDGTARPSMTGGQDYTQSVKTIPMYYFSSTALNFPQSMNWPVYTGPGEEYIRAGNGIAQFNSRSFKYGGLDGNWMFVRCVTTGKTMRYGYIYVGGYRQTVQSVPSFNFSYSQAVITRRTGVWDSLMDNKLGPVCYLEQGTRVTYLCDFTIDGMTLAYVEAYWNNHPVRGFVYPDAVRAE